MTTCEFCGQVLLDNNDCTCAGATAEKRRQRKITETEEIIKDICSNESEGSISSCTVDLLLKSCPLIIDGIVKEVAVQTPETIKVKIKRAVGGKVEVERTYTSKIKDETSH